MMQSLDTMQVRPPEIPLTFRQEIVPHIFRAILGGWSCALVGLRGVGTSNLMRFICEPRVVASRLGESLPLPLFIYIESGLLVSPAELYTTLTQQLLLSAKTFDWPKAEQAALRNYADHSTADGQPRETDGAVMEVLSYVCGSKQRRVVIVFDEFDEAFIRLPTVSLRRLRKVRDDYKQLLSYVVATRTELTRLAARRDPGEAEVSKFTELFDQHTFPVRPYLHADALTVIARKTVEWDQPPTPEQQDRLYRVSGGHAKLLVASLVYLSSRLHLPWVNVERGLREDPGLAEICQQIWDELDEAEQTALCLLADERRSEIRSEDLDQLKLKGLVVGGPEFIFAEIFEAFVNARKEQTLSAHPVDDANPPRKPSRLRNPEAKIYW
jgi:hypothetical protein